MEKCPVCAELDNKLIQKSGDYSIVKCVRCGVVYVSPFPPKEKHKNFHNQAYFQKNYEGKSIENFYAKGSDTFLKETQLKTARLSYVNSFCNKGKILDVGTGQGLFPALAKENGWEAFGTDISSYVCEFLNESKQIKMFNGHLEELNLPPNHFDVVTLWHVLEHTYDPYATLLAVKKTLKIGGHLFIAVPNTLAIEMWLRRLLRKPYFREDADEWHFYGFNSRALKHLLNRLSFKIEGFDVEYYLKNGRMTMVYDYLSRTLLRLSGIDICRTILVHALKTDNVEHNEN